MEGGYHLRLGEGYFKIKTKGRSGETSGPSGWGWRNGLATHPP